MLKRNWRTVFAFLSFDADLLAIVGSALIAFEVRKFLPNLPVLHARVFVLYTIYFAVALFGVALVLGLYRTTFHSDARRQFFIAGKAYLVSILIVFSSLYIFQDREIPRRFTFLFFLILPLLFSIFRAALSRINLFLRDKGFGIRRVLLVGYENGGEQVFQRFRWTPELLYEVKGVVTQTSSPTRKSIKLDGELVPAYGVVDLKEVIREKEIDRIFLPHAETANGHSVQLYELCRKHRVKMKVLSPDADNLLAKAGVNDIAGITLYSPPRPTFDSMKRYLKRFVDVIGSSLLIVLLSPIFLGTSLAIIIESGFPVFFQQKRSRLKGTKPFYFYKFRSMVKHADELKESLFELNEASGALFKIKNDPRVTKVGQFIRKYSIDELPQLFNVLKGDMSLVGPRPLPIADFDKVEEGQEFWELIKDRSRAKPGMTGLWQVSGRSHVGFKEMVLLDMYYVENQSFLFDLDILFSTIPVVLFGRGAY